MQDELPYSQSRISKHLGTLRHAGLVSTRREGTWVYYSVEEEALEIARDFVDQLERSKGLSTARIEAVRTGLANAEKASGGARRAALNTLSTSLAADAKSRPGQITVGEISKGLETDQRVELSVERDRCANHISQGEVTPEQRGNISVVFRFCALLNYLYFRRGYVQQRSGQYSGVRRCLRFAHAPERQPSEEGDFHWTAAIHKQRQRVRAGLRHFGLVSPRYLAEEGSGVESLVRKKVKIQRRPVSKPERNRRPSVKDKVGRRGRM